MKRRLIKRIREKEKYVEPKYSYLKYFRTIRQFIQKKHDISLNEFEILLFFYDEDIYTENDAIKHLRGMHQIAIPNFKNLLRREFIMPWRHYGFGIGQTYTMSPMAKRIIKEFYGKLHGEEIFSEADLKTPAFKARPVYTKAYTRMVDKMAEELKKSRITKR